MKEPVICFAVGNADYLDPIIVATNSFAEYNPDIPLVVFLTEYFRIRLNYLMLPLGTVIMNRL